MWPVVAEQLTAFTIAPSGRVTTNRVALSDWAGPPAIESGDLGAGLQITHLRANTVELRFHKKLLADLAYHDSTATTGGMELQGDAFFDAVTQHAVTSSVFDVTYSNASSGDAIRVKVEAITATEGPDYFAASLGAPSSAISISTANKTLGAWELPALRLKAMAEGNDERMLSTTPYLRGQANGAPMRPTPFGEFGAVYPNLDTGTGGTMTRALGTTSAVFQPAGTQHLHVFDRDSHAGMLVVVADPGAHYKVLYQNGDNVSHITGVRHLPPNGRGRTSLGGSDASGDYSVRIIPFRGGIAEGAHEYLRIVTEELDPSWLPTRIQEDALEASVAGWGYGQKRSGMLATSLLWATTQLANYNEDAGGNRGAKAGGGDGMTTTGSGEGLSEAATITRVSTALTKLIAQVGSLDGFLGYGFSDEAAFENKRNDHWTNFAESLWAAIAALVRYPAIYTMPHIWCGDSKWLANSDGTDAAYGWASAHGDPDDVIMVDKAGAQVSVTNADALTDPVTGGSVAASFSESQFTPNLGDAATRSHILDLLQRRFITGDAANGIAATAGLKGGYIDAFTAVFGGEDYRAGLTDDQKGISAYHALGGVALAQALRTIRPTNDFGWFSEWPNEPTGLNLDGVSVSTNPIVNQGVLQAPLSIGVFNFVWSQYVPRFDFYQGFSPLVSTLEGASTAVAEAPIQGTYWRLIFQHAIAHGSVILLQSEFANRADLVPDDVNDPDDPAYTAWHAWVGDTLAFFKAVIDELRAVGAAPGIFGGKKLRDLEGTAQANLLDDAIVVTASGITGAEVHGAAWYVDNPRPTVFVVLTTGETTDQSFTLKMDRGRHPDLPTGTLKVVEIGAAFTSETVVTTFDDVLSLDLTLTAERARIFKIERSA